MTANIGAGLRGPLMSNTESIQETQQTGASTDQAIQRNAAEASQEKADADAKDNTFGIPNREAKKAKPNEELRLRTVAKGSESVLVMPREADEFLRDFTGDPRNRQYRLETDQLKNLILSLGDKIKADSTPEDILTFVQANITILGKAPDFVHIDKTLDCLIDFTRTRLGKTDLPKADRDRFEGILTQLQAAKVRNLESHPEDVYVDPATGKSYSIGHAIVGTAGQVAEAMGESGDVKFTMNYIREKIHTPLDLSAKYQQYKNMKMKFTEIKADIDKILSFAGVELKQKDIPNPIMNRLLEEIRTLQSMLQIFRQFKRDMPLAHSLFARWVSGANM